MNIERAIKKTNNVFDNNSMKPLFDIVTLDMYCRYIISSNQNIRISGLNLVKELFSRVNPKDYGNDIERINRIEFIKRGLEARLEKQLTDKNLIIQYINGGPIDKPLLDTSGYEEISDEILAYLNEQAAELTKSYFVDERYEKILSLATDLKNENYTRRSDVVQQIQQLTSELNLNFNKMDDAASATQMFSLVPGEFESAMTDIYARETSPSRILKSGMTGLNLMLNGGFQAGRVYLIAATAAGGKSFTMLDLAMQIKKYNKNYISHDLTKIPTIVFLTMENSQDENVSRLMGMVSNKTFNDYSLDESFEIFRNNGLGYSEEDPIDIVMIYKPNLSVNTDYLYTLVDKMHELGREPICIFQDHLKRIRPVHKRNDLRLDLAEVINEFKAFATACNVPVITDTHLNRDAAKILGDTKISNKQDMTRLLGSSNISESYLMIDNCDVCFILNKEYDTYGHLYMAFKQVKTRTQCDLEFFYQPYIQDNLIKLVEDTDEVVPAFRRTLHEEAQLNKSHRKNDYTGNISKAPTDDEEDDLFSEKVLGAAPQSEILLPDNNNQAQFVLTGQPSQPVYPMPEVPIMGPINQSPIEMDEKPALTEWEQELINRKYTTDAKTVIAFLDENGLVINDGVEDIVM